MKARSLNGHANAAALSMSWASLLSAGCKPSNSHMILAAALRSCYGPPVMTWIFCFSLWTSSLLVIWVSRGWIGLFFSGQVLYAGVGLWKSLRRRTRDACSRNATNSRIDR